MEILKGFVFNIQRFATVDVSAGAVGNIWVLPAGSSTVTLRAAEANLVAGDTVLAVQTGANAISVAANRSDVFTLINAAGGGDVITIGTFAAVTAANSATYVTNIATNFTDGASAETVTIGTAAVNYTLSTTGTVTASSDGGITGVSATTTVTSGTAPVDASGGVVNLTLRSSTEAVTFIATKAITANSTVTFPDRSTVQLTEATNTNATTVSGNKTVTGVDTGSVIVASSSGVQITTATNATGNTFRVNNILYTLTTGSTTPLIFTTDTTGNGASTITGLSGGVLTTSAGDTVTINNKRYVGTSGLTVTGNAAGTTSTLTAGDVTIDSTATNSVDTTFETGNGSISISNGRATVRATAAGTASLVLNLTAGASLTAKYGTGLTVAAVAGTRESSTYTVNDMTFTQGFNSLNANTAMTFRTTTSGATLIDGSAYLNGSGTVVVSDPNATAESTISSTNGDITITANGAGGFEIGDLDNGDSFTVSVGTDRRTYTVSNGRLFDSLGNVSAASFNASDSTYASVLVVSGITAGTVFTASGTGLTGLAGAIASNTNLNTSHGSLAPASDVTGRSLGVSSVTGAAAAGSMRTVTEYANGNYLHTNGLVDSTSTDALGTLDSTSDYFTYTATGTRGQTIDMNNALARTGAADNGVWKIVGTGAADHIFGNGRGSTLDGGAGADTIVAAAGDIALGGEGNDDLTAAANNVTLSGGTGADTLTAAALATGTTTLTGGDGADVFVINDGATHSAVITDFDFANDVLLDNAALTSTFAGLTNTQVGADGHINLNGGVATINASNGAYFAQVRGSDNRKQAVGWVGENATAIDASSLTVGAVIIGNTNTEGDSLYGGSAGDTLYGGAGDTVWGGAGRNSVTLSGAASDAKHVLGFGADNATTHDVVSGFTTGFEAEDSDKLVLVGGVSTVSTSLTGSGAAGQLTIKSGSSDLIMRNVNVNGTTGAAEVRVGDSKVAFVASGSVATVSSASYADMYFGTKNGSVKSGLSFANIEDSLEVNLSDSKYTNIASVTGGTGNTSLLGGADAETLISAGGNTSLYGGAGKDVLVGRTTAADTFFALDGIGTDTVSGFEGYTENTAETADTVYLSSVSAAKLGSNGITLNLNDSDKLVLTGTGVNANTEVRFTTDGTTFGIAKIGSVAGGNNFTYAKEVTYYGGGNGNDTLTFSSGDSDDHQVWLDGSKGVSYSKVNIINGASASGSLELAGDSAKNTITGGSGDDSLWGGSGNTADRLVGNSGANTFFYGLGEGKDTLVSGSADDTVNLYNINLSDVMSGEITNAGVTVNMNDGSTLTVATSRDIKFNLASGESYIANHSTKQWDNA